MFSGVFFGKMNRRLVQLVQIRCTTYLSNQMFFRLYYTYKIRLDSNLLQIYQYF